MMLYHLMKYTQKPLNYIAYDYRAGYTHMHAHTRMCERERDLKEFADTVVKLASQKSGGKSSRMEYRSDFLCYSLEAKFLLF